MVDIIPNKDFLYQFVSKDKHSIPREILRQRLCLQLFGYASTFGHNTGIISSLKLKYEAKGINKSVNNTRTHELFTHLKIVCAQENVVAVKIEGEKECERES